MSNGFVYFVKAGTEFVKIGFSENPEMRVYSIRSDNPLPLKLLGVIPGNKRVEKDIQERFSHRRIRGEWFDFCKEIKDYINKNASEYIPKARKRYKVGAKRTQFPIYMSSENISYLKYISTRDDVSMSSVINSFIAQRRL